MSVCPLGIATTRVRRGLLLKIPTAYEARTMAGAQGYWRSGAVPRAVPVVWNQTRSTALVTQRRWWSLQYPILLGIGTM